MSIKYTRILLMNDDGSLYNFIINTKTSKEIDFVNQLGKKQQSFIDIQDIIISMKYFCEEVNEFEKDLKQLKLLFANHE